MTNRHLGQMVLDHARGHPGATALRVRRGDAFANVTWGEALPRIEALPAGLLSAAPVRDGARIALLCSTSLDAVLLDFASLSVGLQPVFVYASLLAEEVGYMHVDTAAELVVVENAAQLEKVRRIRGGFSFFGVAYGTEKLAIKGRVIVIDPTGIAPADDWESLADAEARGRARLPEMKAEMERRTAQILRSHTATFTYTSGTTGPPKAVIQTHDNFLSSIENAAELNFYDANAKAHGLLLFMPLAHVFGRFAALCGTYYGVPLIISTFTTLASDLDLTRPGMFFGVPRVFEKIMIQIERAMTSAKPVPRALFQWAIGVGRETFPYVSVGRPLPTGLAIRHRIADKLVLSKVRKRLGLENASTVQSGGAAVGSEVQTFFTALGLPLIEGYGLTEVSPALTSNRKNHFETGSVGPALKGVTLRFAEDGEILAKGANVTPGYLNRPDANAEAFDAEGWFHTGDLGAIDAKAFVTITGRKKDLLKTSGGKYIAPLKLESRLKQLPFIHEPFVVGDNRHYVTCLFFLDRPALAEWCTRAGIAADPAAPQVLEALEKLVAEVNRGLASFETIKYFRVVPEPLAIETGELTHSMKVKRKVVAEKYKALIDGMYVERTQAS